MPSQAMEEFARMLVQRVRDSAIRGCDSLLAAHSNSPEARRWRQITDDVPSLRVMVPDVVDATVFQLLVAIDEGALPLKFVHSSGREVDLTVEGRGEMAGWYMGSGGWRPMFSEERFADDCADPSESLG